MICKDKLMKLNSSKYCCVSLTIFTNPSAQAGYDTVNF